MTPAARVQAAIEILDDILAGRPAEQALTRWARGARYAGSKDRAGVRDHVFQALRCKRSYAALGSGETGRGLMIGALRDCGQDPGEIFTGMRHAPAALTAEEAEHPARALSVAEARDLPDWLWPRFEASLGVDASAQAHALRQRAPIVLRVNMHVHNVAQATEILCEGGIKATPCDIAETALTVTEGARRVAQSRAYLEGAVELQDGSSQAAMAGLDLAPGGRMLDYCAGGGGKVLALAARNPGVEWFAHDADPTRMSDLPARAARAGVAVSTLERGDVASHGPYDMVLCDAPCSGSGTWRRAPDAKWRLTPERLSELADLQLEILLEAADHVAPGGQLVYATCSVLEEENEATIARFTSDQPGWHARMTRRWPIGPEGDGFFLCVLSKGEG
jgi:16S rRNA (cytosine967-C5)-methyltransferase